MDNKTIINRELPYYDEMQYFCLKNCFNQYMSLLGMENSLLKLRTGLEFKIMLQNNLLGFSTIQHTLFLPFFDMKGVISGNGNNTKEIFEKNICELPVIALVDVFYLPHRKEFQKYHASHAILFCDYNPEEKEVLITDWYAPYFFKGTIPVDLFLKARESENPKDANPFSGFAIDNYWYKVPENMQIDDLKNMEDNICAVFGSKRAERENNGVGYAALCFIGDVITGMKEKDLKTQMKMCIALHDELFVWQRAAGLSRRYFEEAQEKLQLTLAPRWTAFLEAFEESFKKINFWLIRGSIMKTAVFLEKTETEWKRLLEQYEEITELVEKGERLFHEI